MSNKILEIMLVILLTIASFLGLFVMIRCVIQIVIFDYEMWKRNKAEKDRCRQMEDKFRNRKLTD